MIAEQVLAYKAKKAENWPVRSNRASEMGHPCTRYLVLNRTQWQKKALPTPELQMIFDIGTTLEQQVIDDMRKAGFTVNEQQRGLDWKEYQITGSIDGTILMNGNAYPLEIKTCSPYVFDKVNTIDDMLNSKFLYMRKYPAQLTLYCLMKNLEKGCFVFKNKVSGLLKDIWMNIDYDLGESLLRKAEEINKHLAANTVPDPIPWEESVCGECAFLNICMPDRIGKEVEISDDGDLRILLDQWYALKDSAKRFDELDEEIKAKVKEREKILVGDFYIEGKWRETTKYDIPKEIKEPYARKDKYWMTKIVKV